MAKLEEITNGSIINGIFPEMLNVVTKLNIYKYNIPMQEHFSITKLVF